MVDLEAWGITTKFGSRVRAILRVDEAGRNQADRIHGMADILVEGPYGIYFEQENYPIGRLQGCRQHP